MSYDTARPLIASYLLIEKGGKIAFVLRSNTPWMNGHYGLPSGKVEKGESFTETAIREAKEEVGIYIAEEYLEQVHTVHRYHKGEKNGEWVDIYFRVKKWTGKPYNAEPHVHSELAWLNPNDSPVNVIPSTKHAIEQIQQGKTYSEYGFK